MSTWLPITQFLKKANLRLSKEHIRKLCREKKFENTHPLYRCRKNPDKRRWEIRRFVPAEDTARITKLTEKKSRTLLEMVIVSESLKTDDDGYPELLSALDEAYYETPQNDWSEYWERAGRNVALLMASVWAKQYVRKMSPEFETLSDLLSESAPSEAVQQFPLENITTLMELIERSYKYSSLHEEPVDLAISFKPTGAWEVRLDSPNEPILVDYVNCKGKHRKKIERYATILKGIPKSKNCINPDCTHTLKKRQRLYCSPSCKNTMRDWLDLRDCSSDERRRRFLNKFPCGDSNNRP